MSGNNLVSNSSDDLEDHNDSLARLTARDLLDNLFYSNIGRNSSENLSFGRMSMAWDRLRQTCIDYQIVPPTATELIDANYEVVFEKQEKVDEFKKFMTALGYFAARSGHVVRLPCGRLVDIAIGCLIS